MTTISNANSIIKGYLRLSSYGSSNYVVYQITSAVNETGWWTINLSYTSSNASFTLWPDDEKISVSFVTNGDRGDDGEQGDKGEKGERGADGYVGSDGADGAQGFTGATGSQGFTGFQGHKGVAGTESAAFEHH